MNNIIRIVVMHNVVAYLGVFVVFVAKCLATLIILTSAFVKGCLYMAICDRIYKNPAFHKTHKSCNAAQVEKCQNPVFVIFMSKNLPSNRYHHLRRLYISYQTTNNSILVDCHAFIFADGATFAA